VKSKELPLRSGDQGTQRLAPPPENVRNCCLCKCDSEHISNLEDNSVYIGNDFV